MPGGTAGRPSELSSGAEQPVLPSGLCSLPLCSFPGWKLLEVVSELGELFQPTTCSCKHTPLAAQHGSHCIPGEPGRMVRARRSMLETHFGAARSQFAAICCLDLHSSTMQSLGNPLAAIGKAVLKHGNIISKHNN